MIPTAEGLIIHTTSLNLVNPVTVDKLIVPGAPNIQQTMTDSADLVDWLRTASHWSMCDMLKSGFPTIDVDIDAIFIKQGTVWTSAGVTAGIDMALAFVEADCGREVALQVARELVMFLKRPGGQAQFSMLLQPQTEESADFDDLYMWISANLGDAHLSVEILARRAQMSPRNFARMYKR